VADLLATLGTAGCALLLAVGGVIHAHPVDFFFAMRPVILAISYAKFLAVGEAICTALVQPLLMVDAVLFQPLLAIGSVICAVVGAKLLRMGEAIFTLLFANLLKMGQTISMLVG
jgi:hypothetical protein